MSTLQKNNFEVTLKNSPEEAYLHILNRITELSPYSISFGDSMTLYSTGIIEWLRSQTKYKFIDTFEKGIRFKELIERRREALLCDLFFTGINAISYKDGALHWLDMIGNRIAPISFGPRHVILVAGIDKIVATQEDAWGRIKDIAAPLNAVRHESLNTPCIKAGKCLDCYSPNRICNERLIIHKCYPQKRIEIILINKEKLGL